MGKRLLVLITFLVSFSALSYDTIIISDFDDTIKQTNVDSAGRAVINAVFTRKIFAGMPDLFETMDTYTSDFFILSNSPNMFRFNIFGLLRKHDINPKEVSTRNLLRDSDGFKYKYNYVVNKIKSSDTKVILFGDDVGEDPEVYEQVKKDYPDKVEAIYIHKVTNREIPKGLASYISIFDVVVNEYQAHRMNLNQAIVLGENVQYDYNMSLVLPKFAHCPTKTDFWNSMDISELNDMIDEIANRITKFCIAREK